ncbi:hypothetical protein L484_017838 [Morus notabilis]|uniref:Uncharacterized protein n=1 Tax=Morus notabilis TaxID=981085 RepID=W9QQ25_9ROSA|nr:hypothetical protein L484_017838 [Morus notabilis]
MTPHLQSVSDLLQRKRHFIYCHYHGEDDDEASSGTKFQGQKSSNASRGDTGAPAKYNTPKRNFIENETLI